MDCGWIDYQFVPLEVERAHFEEAMETHTRVTGARPLGWYTGRTSPNTRDLVKADGGFLYDSDSYADDLPYWEDAPHGPHLVIPYTLDANDMRFATAQGFNSADQFHAYLRDMLRYALPGGGGEPEDDVGRASLPARGETRPRRRARTVPRSRRPARRRVGDPPHRHRPPLARPPPALTRRRAGASNREPSAASNRGSFMNHPFEPLNPPPRRLMGPGPVDVDPRVLRAMSLPLLGQFDPRFTGYMNEVMALYRQVFRTANRWTLLVDGTARAGIEAVLVSVLEPGDRVLVPVFGRFGHLLCEIARRCRAEVVAIETEWGTVFDPQQVEEAVKRHRPKLVAVVQGDTSTTMAQPLDAVGRICREQGALVYVDATASVTGMPLETDAWQLDAVSAGLQKCLSRSAGHRAGDLQRPRGGDGAVAPARPSRASRPDGYEAADGRIIQSNYFDLSMLMDYWSESRLNHHTEATSMLYAARECARIVVDEGLEQRFDRHAGASRAMTAGLAAMDLELFGDQAHKMPNVTGVHIPDGVPGDAVRAALLADFGLEIGTSFGPLHGKIWRIGTMGYGCRRDNVMTCLAALEVTLRRFGHASVPGAGVEAALAVWDS